MSQETLNDKLSASERNQWRTGDTIFLVAGLVYAAFNVVLMLMYASSRLGPVPFDLISLFFFVSVLGMVAAFPIQLMLRAVGVTWRSAVAVIICFGALAVFNLWCGFMASAAV